MSKHYPDRCRSMFADELDDFFSQTKEEVKVSKIEDAVIAKIQARAEIGRQKYGTTMARKDLTFRQWVTHLQEELLDAAIYAEKLLDEISIPDMKENHDNQDQ